MFTGEGGICEGDTTRLVTQVYDSNGDSRSCGKCDEVEGITFLECSFHPPPEHFSQMDLPTLPRRLPANLLSLNTAWQQLS